MFICLDNTAKGEKALLTEVYFCDKIIMTSYVMKKEVSDSERRTRYGYKQQNIFLQDRI